MTQNPFEIPQQMRELAEKNIEQARAAYDQFMGVREVISLQSKFAQSQMQAYAMQAQELGRLIAEAMQKGAS